MSLAIVRTAKALLIVGAVVLAVRLSPFGIAFARSPISRKPEYEAIFPKPLNRGLELRLKQPLRLSGSRGYFSITATITNSGSETAVLSLPVDGSYGAMRIPVDDWSILPVHLPATHTVGASPFGGVGLCGSLDPIPANAIFKLRPGQQKTIVVAAPWIQRRGSYRVKMYYTTIAFTPELEGRKLRWESKGIHLTPCTLVSNEVTLTEP